LFVLFILRSPRILVQRIEENRIPPKKVLYMNLETIRLRGRPRNRWQDKVRVDGKLVGGKWWKERVYNREEWKKLLRTARNRRILQMPMEWMNEWKESLAKLRSTHTLTLPMQVKENIKTKGRCFVSEDGQIQEGKRER
jgi:hypothetical protein